MKWVIYQTINTAIILRSFFFWWNKDDNGDILMVDLYIYLLIFDFFIYIYFVIKIASIVFFKLWLCHWTMTVALSWAGGQTIFSDFIL